ncbi:MAG: YeeE/YedE family protein [Leptolyngbyaceae bacterium]|nr:YeeE/YedE family protein [Leptolyngbyaceae bacterium]
MIELNWAIALTGGALIGLSATLLLWANGRIAGISGIVNGALEVKRGETWRWLFLIGMILGGAIYEYGLAAQPTPMSGLAPGAMILGGFIVGMGTRLGSGCTSGHGVCGLGRLSGRSLTAVLTFLATGMMTVFILRHLLAVG